MAEQSHFGANARPGMGRGRKDEVQSTKYEGRKGNECGIEGVVSGPSSVDSRVFSPHFSPSGSVCVFGSFLTGVSADGGTWGLWRRAGSRFTAVFGVVRHDWDARRLRYRRGLYTRRARWDQQRVNSVRESGVCRRDCHRPVGRRHDKGNSRPSTPTPCGT